MIKSKKQGDGKLESARSTLSKTLSDISAATSAANSRTAGYGAQAGHAEGRTRAVLRRLRRQMQEADTSEERHKLEDAYLAAARQAGLAQSLGGVARTLRITP